MSAKNCECCMMPLSKDPNPNGTEKYCSYCYVDGKLLAEGMSLKEFQDKSYKGMKESGMNSVIAWFFTKMIKFAPYWKTRAKA